MSTTTMTTPAGAGRYLLWFRPLAPARIAPRAFRCDAAGRIELDAISDRDRDEYLFARALVGHAFARPAVRAAGAPAAGDHQTTRSGQ